MQFYNKMQVTHNHPMGKDSIKGNPIPFLLLLAQLVSIKASLEAEISTIQQQQQQPRKLHSCTKLTSMLEDSHRYLESPQCVCCSTTRDSSRMVLVPAIQYGKENYNLSERAHLVVQLPSFIGIVCRYSTVFAIE